MPGDDHRRQRKMLNPAFNINHMREMTPIFYEVTHKVSRASTSTKNYTAYQFYKAATSHRRKREE